MFDAVIIGSGPAGLFAAQKLIGKDVVLLDVAGLDRTDILHGFGGAGTFSDGKFDYTEDVGGHAHKVIGHERFMRYLNELKSELTGRGKNVDLSTRPDLVKEAESNGLKLITYPLQHLGTDGVREYVKEKYDYLSKFIKIMLGEDCFVNSITRDNYWQVNLKNGKTLNTKNVMIATGRSGASLVKHTLDRFDLKPTKHHVDIGFRLEIPYNITGKFTDALHDVKIKGDCTRTFCVCPQGEVVWENREEGMIANGQSYYDVVTGKTNMAILVALEKPTEYGSAFIRFANSGREDVKNISDIKNYFPAGPYEKIMDFMGRLEKIFPGISAGKIYFPEVKTYGSKYEISENFEVMPGLFTIGDCSGYTRNIVHAAISGMAAGEYI